MQPENPSSAAFNGAASRVGQGRWPSLVVGGAMLVLAMVSTSMTIDAISWPPRPSCDDITHDRRVGVSTIGELEDALAGALPGDLVVLADGIYRGTLEMQVDGVADRRITVCASGDAVIDGGTLDTGYAVHITGDHWTVIGLRLRNANKGIVLDGARHAELSNLEIAETGQEAVHFRRHSSDNRLSLTWIHDTGKLVGEYGEGVYVGSAESNWCRYTECQPDRSDRNVIERNRIGPNVTAESIDVKEGTAGGLIRDNRFDGTGMVDADSWVDVKGDGYRIEGNVGRQSAMHGFQVHEKVGWGHDVVFVGNVAHVEAAGYGFEIDTDSVDVIVACDNEVTDAAAGWANVPCIRGVARGTPGRP